MTMGNDNSPHFIFVFNQVTHIRNDQVDAEHVIVRKCQTGIDDNDIIAVLDNGHVLTDFAQASQRNYKKFFLLSQFLTSYTYLGSCFIRSNYLLLFSFILGYLSITNDFL